MLKKYRRFYLPLAISGILTLFISTLAFSTPYYDIMDIGTLGGSSSRVSDINNSGQVVGSSMTNSVHEHAFLWDSTNGMVDISPNVYAHTGGKAINDSGQVVGTIMDEVVFYWDSINGYIPGIGTLPSDFGFYTYARDINNSGQVVGVSGNVSNHPQAYIWDIVNGSVGLGFAYSVRSINDSGQVLCKTDDNDVFLWDSVNGLQDLGFQGNPRSINNLGQVVGTDDGNVFLWDSVNGLRDLGFQGNPDTINDSGQIVGSIVNDQNDYHAFLWDSVNGLQNLNNLLPDSSVSILTAAKGINNLNQIACDGISMDGQHHAFLLSQSWDTSVTTTQSYLTDFLTLGDTFSFDYWWEMDIEPTKENFDILLFNGTEWETFGWNLNFDGSSSSWETASFYVPEWARGGESQILFRIFDFGEETNPTVYLRNIAGNSAPVPEPATILLLGIGCFGLVRTGRKKFTK